MSRLLACCAGASVGYLVGFLAGAAVRDLTSLRTAGRARTGLGAPQPPPGPRSPVEPLSAAQIAAQAIPDQRADSLDLDDDELDALLAAVKGEPCTCKDTDEGIE